MCGISITEISFYTQTGDAVESHIRVINDATFEIEVALSGLQLEDCLSVEVPRLESPIVHDPGSESLERWAFSTASWSLENV